MILAIEKKLIQLNYHIIVSSFFTFNLNIYDNKLIVKIKIHL